MSQQHFRKQHALAEGDFRAYHSVVGEIDFLLRRSARLILVSWRLPLPTPFAVGEDNFEYAAMSSALSRREITSDISLESSCSETFSDINLRSSCAVLLRTIPVNLAWSPCGICAER
jgi:hypothetical protein